MSGYLHFYAQHPAIALVAEKLNESGHAFHNTADWQDETDYLGGKSACDIVQEALNAADESFNALAARVAELERDIIATYDKCMAIVEASNSSGDECCISAVGKAVDAIDAARSK